MKEIDLDILVIAWSFSHSFSAQSDWVACGRPTMLDDECVDNSALRQDYKSTILIFCVIDDDAIISIR